MKNNKLNQLTQDDKRRVEIVQRSQLMVERKVKWLDMPGDYWRHKVLAIIGGIKLRRASMERVFNDAALIDWAHGKEGAYLDGAGSVETINYHEAVKRYGKTPYAYAVECMGHK